MIHRPLITLLTDFGERGGYTGVMKGVIYTTCPDAVLIDLTHQVMPQQVREGAFLLHITHRYFPPGAVHLAVVDPGVGTARRPLCLDVPGVGRFVGPDNGLFSYIVDAYPAARAYVLANETYFRQPVSPTFHGRDIFAPVATALAGGEPVERIGSAVPVSSLVCLDRLWPRWDSGGRYLEGAVVHIDRFGNLIANLPRASLAGVAPEALARARIVAGGFNLTGIQHTYGAHRPGEAIALFGSSGFLEIARVNGRAAQPYPPETVSPDLGLPVRVIV